MEGQDMFTGLIEQTGTLAAPQGGRLAVIPSSPFISPQKGESVAVNGCCLTLEGIRQQDGALLFFTLQETLRLTNIGSLRTGAKINLERAMPAGGRFGGHIVTGHIDAAVKIISCGKAADGDTEMTIELPEHLSGEVIKKGSVAVNGVSLTVAEIRKNGFSVRLIPATLNTTNLGQCSTGDIVNLETDILGKYIRGLYAGHQPEHKITMNMLNENGFTE